METSFDATFLVMPDVVGAGGGRLRISPGGSVRSALMLMCCERQSWYSMFDHARLCFALCWEIIRSFLLGAVMETVTVSSATTDRARL